MNKPFSSRPLLWALLVAFAAILVFWNSTRDTATRPLASGQNANAARHPAIPALPAVANQAMAATTVPNPLAPAKSRGTPSRTPTRLWAAVGGTQGTKLPTGIAELQAMRQSGRALTGRVGRFEGGSLAVLADLQPGEIVTLPLLGGEEAAGRVNLVQAGPDSWLRIGGSLTGDREGTFALNSNGAKFEGSILLPGEALALMISGDANGVAVMEEKPIGEVLCTPMPKADVAADHAAGVDGEDVPAAGAAIPILSSRPTATAVIYLDFDGETVTDPRWNGGLTIVAAAPNVSAADIMQAWASVKEDYWAFNVDVTTDLNRYNNAPVNRRTRCIVTPTDTAAPGSGGVAYVGCFSRAGTSAFSATIPCWVFVSGAKPIAEAISHEVGHTLGLHHDGRTGEEYYAGAGSGAVGWAPIMGVGYYRELVQWSKGEYPDASNTEDDLAIISSPTNGLGYVADEAGNTRATAALLGISGSTINQTGIITQSSDSDYYVVTVSGGSNVSIAGNPAATSPDLDLALELQDASGNVLAASNPDLALNASINTFLAAGTYYIKVQGTGRGSVAVDGYSNYASIGAYTLTGTISGAAQAPTISGLTDQSAVAGVPTAALGFTVADADTNVNLLTLSATSSNQTVMPNGNISFGGSGAARTITLVPAPGQSGPSTITVTVSDGALTGSGSFLVTVAAPTSVPAFTLNPTSQTVPVGGNVAFTATANGTPAPTYQWLKNNVAINGATNATFTISAASLGDAGNYAVTASNSVGSATSTIATLTVNSGGSGAILLTGTPIGSSPWHGLAIGDKSKAFDGDTSTSFDSDDAFIYVGLDLGAAKTITRVRYFPRANWAFRMAGGQIRGANSADLSDAVTLYTIASAPPEGTWQDVTLPPSTASYRYVFFTTPATGYGNIAELELYGINAVPPAGGLLSGTPIGSSPWHGLAIGDKSKAFDGDTSTSFDSDDAFIYVGLDLGAAKTITRVRYFPRANWAFRMAGGQIRGANSADLSDAVTLYTITSAPPEGTWQDVTLPVSTASYRYVFFTTPATGYGNIAELELYGTSSSTPPVAGLLSGSVMGSSPWHALAVGDKSKAFDGDTSTSFDSDDAFIYVGLDLGAAKTITRVRYFPRANWAFRMAGGQIRGANLADLSDAVTLYTIVSAPPEGTWQDVTLPASTASYRYVFFTTPATGYGNVAELEFYGFGATGAAVFSDNAILGDAEQTVPVLRGTPTTLGKDEASAEDVKNRVGPALSTFSLADSDPTLVSFIIEGDEPVAVLIRAHRLMPAGFAAPESSIAPQLGLFRDDGVPIAGNRGWTTAENSSEILAMTADSGTLHLAEDGGDSVILQTLAPGSYAFTSTVPGGDGSLVEIYVESAANAEDGKTPSWLLLHFFAVP